MALSDADLVARVLAGDDRHAFAELVRRHQSTVRGLLRRLTCGDAAWADDLAQDTFVRSYRGLAGFRGGARLSTWMYRIAYHCYLDDLQRRRRAEVKVDGTVHKDMGFARRAALQHDVERAMGVLDERERAVIALAYGQDLSQQDLADLLDMPLGTVKTVQARAKDKLRVRLQVWADGGTA
ncbi:MAG: sigma-70 family RNA polymerase sigma factor [Pseudomonadota bacterium]